MSLVSGRAWFCVIVANSVPGPMASGGPMEAGGRAQHSLVETRVGVRKHVRIRCCRIPSPAASQAAIPVNVVRPRYDEAVACRC